jgi:TPR repeat protein
MTAHTLAERSPVRRVAKTIRYLCVPLLALLLAPAGAMAADEFERGMQAYETSHYAQAVQLLEQAAEHNVRAQEVLGMMYWYGPRLYGNDVPRNAHYALEMLEKAAGGGSQAAQQILATMSRRTIVEAKAGIQGEADD